MGDRNFSGNRHDHISDRTSMVDRCPTNECHSKHCTRKRNLPENSEISQKQLRKQSFSEDEEDEVDLASNFFDNDDDNSSTTEEVEEDISSSSFSYTNLNQTFSGTQAAQAISSLFRNASVDNQKSEIGASSQFHGYNITNPNGAVRGFGNVIDSTCHHHTQQALYNGYAPANSHYVVSYGSSGANGCDGTYGRVNAVPFNATMTNVVSNRNIVHQESNSVELSARYPFNSTRPTICSFGINRSLYGNFGHSLPSLYGMPMFASETFCTVPGRTSLLSLTTKYSVTIGEIYRRISPPECLNASLLGGILRKAKSKDGGKTLRDSLKRVGLTLPAGRRKAATVTAWTALVEEEALQMARDFAALCERAFPVREIAEFIFNRLAWQDNLRDCYTLIEHTRLLTKELRDVVSNERTETVITNQSNTLPTSPAIQHSLAHFSLLTHGFGPLAFVAVFDTFMVILDEMLKCCDRNEQNLNVPPLSVISVTHIPPNRISYNGSNM